LAVGEAIKGVKHYCINMGLKIIEKGALGLTELLKKEFTPRHAPSMAHGGYKRRTIIFVIIQCNKNILINLIIVYRCAQRLTNGKSTPPDSGG
jgi:hypothetical protein